MGAQERLLRAVEEGRPVLLENLPAELDAALDPILGKAMVRRGGGGEDAARAAANLNYCSR